MIATTSAPDWVQRAIEYDVRFHRAIAEASGSSQLRDAVLRYRLLVLWLLPQDRQHRNPLQSFRGHQRVLSALLARDAQAVRTTMREHIAERLATVVRALRRLSRPGSRLPAIEQRPSARIGCTAASSRGGSNTRRRVLKIRGYGLAHAGRWL